MSLTLMQYCPRIDTMVRSFSRSRVGRGSLPGADQVGKWRWVQAILSA